MLENYNHHVSVDFYKTLGWRSDLNGVLESSWMWSILFGAVFLMSLWHHYKNNRKLFLIGLYLGALQTGSYIALQTHWKQDRMIIAYIPLILIFLFTAYSDLIKRYFQKYHLVSIGSTFVLIALISTNGLLRNIKFNQHKISGFMSGDIYSGYTPDWQNYLKMADWADQNLDQSSVIAVRKPNSSKVFSSGRVKFHGLFSSTQDPGEKVLSDFKERSITHIQLCNIRLNPAQAIEGQILGTTYSYARSIEDFKPGTLQGVHKIGNAEPCTLYVINYE